MNGIAYKTNNFFNWYNLLKATLFAGFLFWLNIKVTAGPSNIAPLARVSASVELDSACSAEKVIDGRIDIAGIGEWVSNSRENAWGEIDYPWIQFKWDQKHLIEKLPLDADGNPKFNMYNSDAFWLTQWNLNILWGLGYGGHDEDQGQMGGVSALMSIGLFSLRGTASADPVYEITSPVFDEIRIKLDQRYYPGKTFTIRTNNNSAENGYIQKAELNGKPLNRFWFPHEEFAKGGLLELGWEISRIRNGGWTMEKGERKKEKGKKEEEAIRLEWRPINKSTIGRKRKKATKSPRSP